MRIAPAAAVLTLLLADTAGAARPAVIVDPRLELLAVVHVLAAEAGSLKGFSFNALDYSASVKERFARYRDHPAVGLYRERLKGGFNFVSAFELVMHAKPLPELAPGGTVPAEQAKLLKALAQFARESRFLEFFGENKPRYAGYARRVEEQMKGRDYAGMLAEYGGLPIKARYTIVVCPLCDEPENMNSHDAKQIISTIGPASVEKGQPVFDYREFRLGLWHELGHNLLDPLAETHAARIEAEKALYASVDGCCRGSWEQCVKEHAAIGLSYAVWDWTRRTGRVSEGPDRLVQNKNPPFIKPVVERFKEFELKRSKGYTLKEFYPRLLDVFEELLKVQAGTARGTACGPGTDF